MLAADTSSLIAFFNGDKGADVQALRNALQDARICLPPVVVAELLSDSQSRPVTEPLVSAWPQLGIAEGYWLRAAVTRGHLLDRGLKPKLPDTLIAQSCIDHDVPLITRDTGFRHFAKHCGLKLA